MIKIASIVQTPHLALLKSETYQMALAHLLADDRAYRSFYRNQSDCGSFVLMDNGVVETGEPMPMDDLLRLATEIKASELILPDRIRDREGTLDASREAYKTYLQEFHGLGHRLRAMLVPQGETLTDWSMCAYEMARWPGRPTIGLSKFAPVEQHRGELALTSGGQILIAHGSRFHILGCHSTPREIRLTAESFGASARGVDSGVAAIATQEGIRLAEGWVRPEVPLDFGRQVDTDLLTENLLVWVAGCVTGLPVVG